MLPKRLQVHDQLLQGRRKGRQAVLRRQVRLRLLQKITISTQLRRQYNPCRQRFGMTQTNNNLNLQAWQAEVVLPTHFQSEVWRRIAARDPSHRPVLERWLENLVLLLPQPVYAAALVTACIGLGLGLGYTARSAALHAGQGLYVASINPLAHASSSLE